MLNTRQWLYHDGFAMKDELDVQSLFHVCVVHHVQSVITSMKEAQHHLPDKMKENTMGVILGTATLCLCFLVNNKNAPSVVVCWHRFPLCPSFLIYHP